MREGDYELPKSCREIKLRGFQNDKQYGNGVYNIESLDGGMVKTECDMNSAGGGWTLLVRRVSNSGWTRKNIEFQNEKDPTSNTDYSIFGLVNKLKTVDPGEVSTSLEYYIRWKFINRFILLSESWRHCTKLRVICNRNSCDSSMFS